MSVPNLLIDTISADVLRHAVFLNLDQWPFTLTFVCSVSAVTCSKSVLNFSDIQQSSEELLRFVEMLR